MAFAEASAGLRCSPPVQRIERVARAGVRRLAEAFMPHSMIVWRGPPGSHPPRAGRVALTFDDGPDGMTQEYLAVLAGLGVRAPFFAIGSMCEKRPELVTRIADAGHELGAHGYTHRKFPDLDTRELQSELRETQRFLPRTSSGKPLVRPP